MIIFQYIDIAAFEPNSDSTCKKVRRLSVIPAGKYD